MTNHSHFIAIPAAESSLSLMMRDAHREYARRRNRERSLRGHLFQERFYSYPVQADAHLLAVARYIELNPTGAGLASSPLDYQWSSARYHCSGCADPLVQGSPLRAMVPDWRLLLQDGQQIVNDNVAFEKHLKAGRPLGDDAWLEDLSARTGRRFTSSQRGCRRRS
jgi:putative transposase